MSATGEIGGAQPRGAARYPDAVARLKREARWKPLEILFWVAAVAVYFVVPSQLALFAQVAIMALFALSLDLLIGYSGVISLGHAAFFGLGAYVAGILAARGWGEPLTGLLAAGAVAGLVGFATSFFVLRGSELTRLMVTLGVALIFFEIANDVPWLTGGSDGLQGIDVWPIFGIWDFDLYGRTAYIYSLAVLFLGFLLVRRIVRSPFGLALRGIKENERRMPALGTPVMHRLIAVYTIAAMLAGFAGALLTETTQFVSLDVLGFDRSAVALLMVLLGGAGMLYGGLIGAIVFTSAQAWLSVVTPEYWQFWIGVAFILLVLFARNGLLGLGVALLRRWQESRRPAAAPEA